MGNRANVTALRRVNTVSPHTEFTQLSTRYDSESESIWCWLDPAPRPCLNPILLKELTVLQHQITATYNNKNTEFIWPLRHIVLASKSPGIYNLGGDLELFKQLIETNDRIKLTEYATGCIQLLHKTMNNLDLPITSIALVQGHALGGGFEAALSCDIVIAERGTQMGFPEVMFNLFPGMGAYNFLARRIGGSLAERIILSGKTYLAEELYEMGVIDVLADRGDGKYATQTHLKRLNRSHKTIRSMKKVRQIVNPVNHGDLLKIIDIWVENAMDLSTKDLGRMDKLLYAQKRMTDKKPDLSSNVTHITRQGDWRKLENTDFPLTTHLGESVRFNRRMSMSRRQNS